MAYESNLQYRPAQDKSRYETLPYDPRSNPPRFETLPYRLPDDQRRDPVDANSLLEEFIFNISFPSGAIAKNPSMDITPGGDRRRMRRGLSPSDVQRLIEANPDFADEIQRMYLPGPKLPPTKLSGIYGGAEGSQGEPAISMKNAEALAGIEYALRGRTPDLNPSVARDTIGRRAIEIMRGA